MTAALVEAGVTRDAGVLCADELRLGLRGQVRRVLAPRGVAVTQRLQLRYEWAYLLLAVGPRSGRLRWHWLARCRAAPIKEILAEWALDAVIWDGAGSRRAKLLADLPTARVRLPPYSPELNPAERVFQEIRRRTEGRTYASVADKQAVAESYLAELAADPPRVRRLCGWDWLTHALDQPALGRFMTAILSRDPYEQYSQRDQRGLFGFTFEARSESPILLLRSFRL